jgi:hypothetical protein
VIQTNNSSKVMTVLCAVTSLCCSAVLPAQTFTEAMITIAERTNYERTSSFQEVVDVIDALDQESELMHRERLLLTREGRDVPIVVLANPVVSSPEAAAASGKPVIYIQGQYPRRRSGG